MILFCGFFFIFFFKQKTAYEMRISDWIQTCALPIFEMTRLAFVWACFLGVAAGVKRRTHVRMVAVVMLLPARLRGLTVFLVHGSFLVFAELGRASCRERACQYV